MNCTHFQKVLNDPILFIYWCSLEQLYLSILSFWTGILYNGLGWIVDADVHHLLTLLLDTKWQFWLVATLVTSRLASYFKKITVSVVCNFSMSSSSANIIVCSLSDRQKMTLISYDYSALIAHKFTADRKSWYFCTWSILKL